MSEKEEESKSHPKRKRKKKEITHSPNPGMNTPARIVRCRFTHMDAPPPRPRYPTRPRTRRHTQPPPLCMASVGDRNVSVRPSVFFTPGSKWTSPFPLPHERVDLNHVRSRLANAKMSHLLLLLSVGPERGCFERKLAEPGREPGIVHQRQHMLEKIHRRLWRRSV